MPFMEVWDTFVPYQPRPQGHLCGRGEEIDALVKAVKISKILGDFRACAVSE